MPVTFLNRVRSSSSAFYDFSLGSLPAGVTLTRASSGYRYNSSGVLVSETTDVARFQYDPLTLVPRGLLVEETQTNAVRNSTMVGAVAGTPGTAPTNWSIGSTVGLTTSVVGTGTINGINYIDIRWQGTASSAGTLALNFETTTGIAALTGQTWTFSAYCQLVAGTLTGLSNPRFNFNERTSGGAFVSQADTTINTPSATLTREVGAYTLIGGATTAAVMFNFYWAAANGAVIDATLRIGLPQAVQASALGSPIKTSTVAVTRAADVALITNASAISDQCWITRARTPRKISGGALNILFEVDDGSYLNRRLIYYTTTGNLIAAAVAANVTTGYMDLGVVANDTDFTIAVRWADNNFAASLNGGAIVTSTLGANPIGLIAARVGRDIYGSSWNSTIKTIETRRTATDAELPLLAA